MESGVLILTLTLTAQVLGNIHTESLRRQSSQWEVFSLPLIGCETLSKSLPSSGARFPIGRCMGWGLDSETPQVLSCSGNLDDTNYVCILPSFQPTPYPPMQPGTRAPAATPRAQHWVRSPGQVQMLGQIKS